MGRFEVLIDYFALEERAFKEYCDADDILGESMTQETREYMLNKVLECIEAGQKQTIERYESWRSSRAAEAEVINSIDLL